MTESLQRLFTWPAALFGNSDNPKPQTRAESRCLARVPVKTPVTVQWRDDGQREQAIAARCIEISESGATIEFPGSIRAGTVVWLSFTKLRLTGSARVKHCTRRGFWYRVGVRFSGSLMRPL